jgi:membrane dipeptidase
MIITDAHCDTIIRVCDEKTSLFSNKHHLDIKRMLEYDDCLQFFAMFADSVEFKNRNTRERILKLIKTFHEQLERHKDNIMLCCNHNDVFTAFNSKKAAAVLSIEGGECLGNDVSLLDDYYKKGIRSICLTWNYKNNIACGVEDKKDDDGLTEFGKEVVKKMNDMGMIVDVSHMAQRSFENVIEISGSPVIASHSNAKAICGHERNLTDSQILDIKKSGGVIGINFYPVFLNNSGKAGIWDIIKHIEHIASLAGCINIGLGSDFDGIEYLPSSIRGVQDTGTILEELARLNYKDECIQNIAGLNFLRVIKEVLG